jgi:gas vesicle protein
LKNVSKSSSKFILAGVAGLAVGAALGLLFAPDKGKKTRKRIRKGIRVLTEDKEGDLGEKLDKIKSIFTGEHDDPEEKQDN